MGAQSTFLQETAFGAFKSAMQTDLEHQKAAMKRDCDAVRAECEKLRTGAWLARRATVRAGALDATGARLTRRLLPAVRQSCDTRLTRFRPRSGWT